MVFFPALELRQNGDVEVIQIKSGQKPTLKDIQTYLKKKVLPTLLTSYPYNSKRITMFGYTKGKDSEVTQHQLPPPYEAAELYGSIILLSHTGKVWDDSLIEPFSPTDYEVFYEKACSGELDVDSDEEADAEAEAEPEVDEEAELDEEVDAEAELEPDVDLVEAEIEEEEEAPRVRVSRKVLKIDPQQLQFQYKSVLVNEETTVPFQALEAKERIAIFNVFKGILKDHCKDTDISSLEHGIYNATIDEAKHRLVPLTWEHETFRWIYTMVAKRVASNFQPNSYVGNKNLVERWKEGEFTLEQLGSWTSYELKPSHWKDLKDQQFRRDKRIQEGNLAMATDRFRCSQCKKKLCSYYELQTRSADEPMTIFISCLNCGKHWKQ